MPLGQNAKAVLEQVSTATITTILLKKGLRNVWMRGPQALNRISRGSWGALSRSASCRRARIWRRPPHAVLRVSFLSF
jgi:hypothetical protein